VAQVIHAERSTDGDGWQAMYSIARSDGEQVVADVCCSGTAESVARAHNNTAALDAMGDNGAALALQLAESAQRGRGVCRISVFFDELGDGSPQHAYGYEKPVP
jgi:hypothetical protein